MMHHPDVRPVLSRLQVPVLMLAGRDDELLDAAEAERVALSAPDSRFGRATGAGYVAPLLVAPSEVTQRVVAFWSEHNR